MPQDVPKMAPICLKSGPTWPSDRPRLPQEGPEMALKGTKMRSTYPTVCPNRPQEQKMLLASALNIAILLFFAHLQREITKFSRNLFERGNGKRDADCAENQLFCTYVNILLSCKPVCIPFSTYMYTFFPRQPVCKGPLYRFYRAAVSRASNPLFDLFLVLVDPWSRGPVHPWARGARGPEDPWSHSCSNMLIAV